MRTPHVLMSPKLILPAIILLCQSSPAAVFQPVPFAPGWFTHDLVVEKSAPPPLLPVTTATMDTGLANSEYTWYERGYKSDWPATGLPTPGSRITSEAAGDHEYLLAASYQENNVLLLDSGTPTGTLTLAYPTTCSVLSVLVSGGGGGVTLAYTIRHQDGRSQRGTFVCRDWLNGPNPAYTVGGRVNITSYIFDLNNTNPRLYGVDVTVTNRGSPVEAVEFTYVSGAGHGAVFSLSGAALAGDPVKPLGISGYNADMVVEATATRPDPLSGVTTATMEDGIGNAGTTWYERGYYPLAPLTGLPPAGSVVTNPSAPDHLYLLGETYQANNAVLLDPDSSRANLTLATPTRYSTISFLTSAGHGPVTNRCIVNHADGSSQTNTFVVPDWFDAAPLAACGQGRVKVGKRMITPTEPGYPRLFSVDLPIQNTNSPVYEVLLRFVGGPLYSHSAVFAVSGLDPSAPTPHSSPATLSFTAGPDNVWVIHSTTSGVLQSTTAWRDNETVWRDEGPISGPVAIQPATNGAAKFFRVRSP
jgi:hypothetical protein